MPKNAEIHYFDNIGEEGLLHSLNKPFSDANSGADLMEIGAVMTLLPDPPKRLLDLGCGCGWTSFFFSKRGYDVTGVDLSDTAIRLANERAQKEQVRNLVFSVGNSERLKYREEFDCVVLYESLHHCDNEGAVVQCIYNALKRGGICVASEPGLGHEKRSAYAIEKYGVNERDMQPSRIIRAGKKAGFRKFKIYPRAEALNRTLYRPVRQRRIVKALFSIGCARSFAAIVLAIMSKRFCGIVVMTK